MISNIQPNNQISSVMNVHHENQYTKAIKVMSAAINIENGIGGSLLLDFHDKRGIQRENRHLSQILKGYKELKSYINEKLERLKTLGPKGTNRMTHIPVKNKEGIALKDHIGGGFSDILYYREGPFILGSSNRPLYIVTPVDSPFINDDDFYDVSRMYQVPSDLYGV